MHHYAAHRPGRSDRQKYRVLVDQRPECRIGRVSVAPDLPCESERYVLPDSTGLLLCGGERCRELPRLISMVASSRVKGTPRRLQLEGPADRPLGLIQLVECGMIVGEVIVPVVPQRLGGERFPREIDRRLYLTENGELGPESELRIGIVWRNFQRTTILSFRPAPVEVGVVEQLTQSNMCISEFRERARARSAAALAFAYATCAGAPSRNSHRGPVKARDSPLHPSAYSDRVQLLA